MSLQKKLSNFLKVLVSDEVRIQNQVSLILKPVFLTSIL